MSGDNRPEALSEQLLGRRFGDLDEEEQRVLRAVASGELVQMDADELSRIDISFGDRMADRVAAIGGSWGFILAFTLILFTWMLINSEVLPELNLPVFDGYPFIFLNLLLSTLAAIQAPIIMMSQNRQSRKDRVTARHDYEVNLRTQLEIVRLHRKVDRLIAAIGGSTAAQN